jgi:hypothetical protein
MAAPVTASSPASARLDFIGIGVQKAATSWLFACLEEHPSIRGSHVSGQKELNFFTQDWELGYRYLHAQFDFGPWLCGEFSPRYFHDADAPGRIAAYNPNAKLILLLRDPVERAFSQHQHEIRRTRLPVGVSFRDALDDNPSYIEQGRYATHLQRWRSYFDEEQLLVLLHDDVSADGPAVLERTFRFLGVDPTFRPEATHQVVNAAGAYRSGAIARLAGRANVAVRGRLGDGAVRAIGRTRLPALIRRANTVAPVAAPDAAVDIDTRSWLRAELADEVEGLEKLIQRDLSAWK